MELFVALFVLTVALESIFVVVCTSVLDSLLQVLVADLSYFLTALTHNKELRFDTKHSSSWWNAELVCFTRCRRLLLQAEQKEVAECLCKATLLLRQLSLLVWLDHLTIR